MLGEGMDDLQRYHVPPAAADSIPRKPVTRQSYIDYIKREPMHGRLTGLYSEYFLAHPRCGHFGPRHALAALALFVADGDRRFGEACKIAMQDYDRAVREDVKKQGWHAFYMHMPTLLELHFRILREKGILTEEDEPWMRECVLFLSRNVHVWGTAPTFWRGPMHRAQGEGVMKRLAALRYPDAPEAKEWMAYSERVWHDWWDYRDNPINDTGYFFGQTFPVILGAHLMGRKEVFTDPGMKPFWERMLYEVTPDGATCPYGAHGGWNSGAPQRLWMLELMARYTRDGRYRWAAHRLFNYLEFQQKNLHKNHLLCHFTKLGLALAYLFADDSIEPVEPEPQTRVLWRKETLRVRGKQAATHYLKELDPAPDRAHICCNLICTDKVMPSKLVFRSGWAPGDLFMLVDLFPRHEPMNPTGIIGLTQYGSAMAMTISSKAVTTHENLFVVEDLSGTATVVSNPNTLTVDAYYMDVAVEELSEHELASHAVVRVKDFLGFPMTARREFFFVKNRFVLVRDEAQFREAFLARVGPVWHTQNVGPQAGPNWANTYFHAPYAQHVPLTNPPRDLLICHAPKADRRLTVTERGHAEIPYSVRYAWQGITDPEKKLHFTFLLLPHEPVRSPSGLAEKIKFLKDDDAQAAVVVEVDENRQEWIVLNAGDKLFQAEDLSTDARQLYLDVRQGKVARVLAREATFLTLHGQDVFRQEERKTYERP